MSPFYYALALQQKGTDVRSCLFYSCMPYKCQRYTCCSRVMQLVY